jgi:hypothetical protein
MVLFQVSHSSRPSKYCLWKRMLINHHEVIGRLPPCLLLFCILTILFCDALSCYLIPTLFTGSLLAILHWTANVHCGLMGNTHFMRHYSRRIALLQASRNQTQSPIPLAFHVIFSSSIFLLPSSIISFSLPNSTMATGSLLTILHWTADVLSRYSWLQFYVERHR